MPRTKAVKKTNPSKLDNENANFYKKRLFETVNECMEEDLAAVDQLEASLLRMLYTEKMKYTRTQLSKTVHELKNMSTIINSTKGTRSSSRSTKRSMSFTEDEGYLTTGSTESRRTSRSRQKAPDYQKSKRLSRSLSRSNMRQHKPVKSITTPISRNKSQSTFGTITPKVKPHVPQVLLRRPKQGEVAVSLQGSPLMVSSTVSDYMANVNIPLPDGRLLSLQPQRGLRMSQIPELNAETQAQIQALRDNLNKMCAVAKRK